jgi:hypothetical protein
MSNTIYLEKHYLPIEYRYNSPISADKDQPRVEKLSMKKKGIGSEARAERMANEDPCSFLMKLRGRHLQKQTQTSRV